ncbi:MAG: DUF2281 domain-containing protein [Cyanobacteriota bacterium]|nr:DUF2281 domain-containing protein [Cyanobacteriota bacterium]
MTSRETLLYKVEQLPEPLLQQVSDFVDFLTEQYQPQTANETSRYEMAKAWKQWFEEVECLEVLPKEPVSENRKLLLDKYRKQNLDL